MPRSALTTATGSMLPWDFAAVQRNYLFSSVTWGQAWLPRPRVKSGVEHVYWTLARHILDEVERGFPFTLSYAGGFPSRDVPSSKVPSWVPDWRAARRGQPTDAHAPLVSLLVQDSHPAKLY